MSFKISPLSGKKNGQQGWALIQVLVLCAVMTFIFHAMSQGLLSMKTQQRKTKNITASSILMSSFMAYLHTAIANKWCIDNKLNPVGPISSLGPNSCNFAHSRSIEYLLLTDKAKENITKMLRNGIRVQGLTKAEFERAKEKPACIEGEVAFSSLVTSTSTHPLAKVAGINGNLIYNPIYRQTKWKPSKIKYVIKQNLKSNDFKESSRQIPLDIKLQLTSEDKDKNSNEKMFTLMDSSVGLSPRELSYFALIVAKNLRLDGKSSSIKGDTSLHTYNDKSEFEDTCKPDCHKRGLLFKSPVFVNHNIYLPQHPANPNDPSPYSPVTFKAPVVLGNGKIKQGTNTFTPRGTDFLKQTWNHTPYFGGFLSGLKVDGEEDKGLNYLADTDDDTMNRLKGIHEDLEVCSEWFLVDNDYSETMESQLQLGSSSGNTHHLKLTKGNKITPQKTNIDQRENLNLITDRKYKMKSVRKNFADSDLKIARLELKIDDKVVVAGSFPKQGTLALQFAFTAEYLNNLNSQITTKQNEKQSVERSIAGIEAQLNRITDPVLQARLRRTLGTLNTQVASLINEINTLNTEKNEVPPAIHLSTKPKILSRSMGGYSDEDMASFLLKVDFQNVARIQSYLSRRSSSRDLKIHIHPFDVAHNGGVSARESTETESPFYGKMGELIYDTSLRLRSSSLRYPHSQISPHPHRYREISQNENEEMEIKCGRVNNPGPSLPGGAPPFQDWAQDLSEYTRASWAITESILDLPRTTIYLNETNASLNGGSSPPTGDSKANFHVSSIAEKCIVESGANFVAGFFVCDTFEIKSRSKPLKIMGTVITSKLNIHKSALESGIRWYNIHHSEILESLQKEKILVQTDGNACLAGVDPSKPIWQREPASQYPCTTLSLRDKLQPISWTTVDPDCVFFPGKNTPICKEQIRRFDMVEYSRSNPKITHEMRKEIGCNN